MKKQLLIVTDLGSFKAYAVDNSRLNTTPRLELIDHFDPEDVLVANRVNGGTQITRLEPEELKNWLEDYSLGQLWEKNELEGRPVPE